MQIKKDNHISIEGWMVSDLQLKGNELIVYAIIFGFSQVEGHTFWGSLNYLAEWTNSTKQGVIKNLKSLVEKGLIEKKDKIINGVKFCEYSITESSRVLNKVAYPIKQSSTRGIKQSLPNTIENNTIENNIDYIYKEEIPKHISVEAEGLASELRHGILANYPNNATAKKDSCIGRWAIDIDKMIRLDGRKPEQIRKAIIWAMNDDFWQCNIWSGKALRKHYDRLEANAKAKFMKHGSITI